MGILPVLDLQQGQIVHACGGDRASYRPLLSTLTRSTRPEDVAQALANTLDLREFYLADLDAIAGHPPAWTVYDALLTRGFQLWVDGGIRQAEQATSFFSQGIQRVVAGLETLSSPEELCHLGRACGRRVVFSLDLKHGIPMCSPTVWGTTDPLALVRQAVQSGIESLLILDLATVGRAQGPSTAPLCTSIRRLYPQLELSTGGGVRDRSDVLALRAVGVDRILVSSALHTGPFTSVDLTSRGARVE